LARGTVIAGNGNDSITIGGPARSSSAAARYAEAGARAASSTSTAPSGHDTINIGSGNATIYSQGYATITGAFGTATIRRRRRI